MASSDFLDDMPSSPLSSVPSDFDRSSEPREVKATPATKSSTSSKRKAPANRPGPARASRRLKTEDSFERSLTSIKEDIILPKVAKSRRAARNQSAATGTEIERTSEVVGLQPAELNEVHEQVKCDVDMQLTEPHISEAVTAPLMSPQPPREEASLEYALDVEAADGDNAIEVATSISVQDAPEELHQVQQPPSPSADEGPKQLVHAQQPLSTPSVDEAPGQPVHTLNPSPPPLHETPEKPVHGQQPEAKPEKDSNHPIIDIHGADTLPESPITLTTVTRSDQQVTISLVGAYNSRIETTEDRQVEQLPTPKVSDETLDQLDLEEPRTSSRPSRKKLQPTKLEDYEPPVKAVSASVKKKAQPLRGNWSVSHLLTNPKSKLATCNLNALLNHEKAWTLLSREQQLQLIAILPPFIQENFPEFPDDMPIPNIMRQVMQSNNSFQADIRLFQEDLAAGRYEPKWLEDAQQAMEKRAQGYFDDWKERNREEFWGQKQKVDWTTNSGESAQYTLVDLVKAGLFEVGDIWCLKCGGQGFKVEKEAKVCVVAADGALSFTYPSGEHKFSTPANGEDILIEGVRSPKALVDAILSEDGRLAGVRRGNAWRDFRCYRKAQDIGSPWDIRELYNVRQSS